MATLKDHQQAMVDLLASGSGIPASASRLAHAMHDVLCHLNEAKPVTLDMKSVIRVVEANSPGLNDKAISKREKPVKTDSPAKWPTSAEQRVKELENTVKQLRAQREKDKNTIRALTDSRDHWAKMSSREPEQAGCRKDDTQMCEHVFASNINMRDKTLECGHCGYSVPWPVDFDPSKVRL